MKEKAKKKLAKAVKATMDSFLTVDANSASCIIMHQPKAPKGLERFKKQK